MSLYWVNFADGAVYPPFAQFAQLGSIDGEVFSQNSQCRSIFGLHAFRYTAYLCVV